MESITDITLIEAFNSTPVGVIKSVCLYTFGAMSLYFMYQWYRYATSTTTATTALLGYFLVSGGLIYALLSASETLS